MIEMTPCLRRREDEAATDTDDTTASMDVGGLGFYSHGDQSLTHHHWVRQVISGGCFGVHCTEAAEAALKGVFRHPLQRVKHQEQNVTHDSMSRYLCNDLLFRALKPIFSPDKTHAPRLYPSGVSNPFTRLVTGKPRQVTMGKSFLSTQAQQVFLHPDVRVAVLEVLDLMCDKLKLPKTTVSYRRLQLLDWSLGQKFVRQDREIFWSTNTDYQYDRGGVNAGGRHDCVRLVQTEEVSVNTGSAVVDKVTAQSCRLVCFFDVSGLKRLGFNLPEQVQRRTHNNGDNIYLILCRFFEAHPLAISRDSEHRPVCPEPLHINNCLWRYALTERPRQVLQSRGNPSDAYLNQLNIFGKTPAERHHNYVNELRAYYSFIHPDEIKSRSNISPLFTDNSMNLSGDWIESVTMI